MKKKKGVGARRPKTSGIAHLLWLLARHEQELHASLGAGKEKEARRELFNNKGIEHSAEAYFGRKPSPSERAKLSQWCRTLIDSGEAIKFPRVGRKTHLRLTELGWKRARLLRKHGGCSPREVEEAVKASSAHIRNDSLYVYTRRCYERSFYDKEWTAEDQRYWAEKILPYQMNILRAEQTFRDHLQTLPFEQRRTEVQRLRNGGTWNPPEEPVLVFTDTSEGTC